MSAELAITGLGVRCAAGFGLSALAAHVAGGTTALRASSTLTEHHTGTIARDDPPLPALPDSAPQRLLVEWAVEVGEAAMAQARLRERIDAGHIALILASNLEDHPEGLGELAARIGDRLDIAGPRLSTSMACASSIAGFALARLLLDDRDARAVLMIGADVLTPRVIGGFAQLGLLCPLPCAPFSTRMGTSLGEGAAAFVLEQLDEDSPDALAWLLAEGLAADAHHETTPEPGGRGTKTAVQAALRRAALAPEAIELVCAHATGTETNDAAETQGLRAALGPALDTIPVTAIKSIVGHAQGAAAAVELATVIAGWSIGVLPGIAGFQAPARPEAPPKLLHAPQPGEPAHTLLIGAGFGGAHAALVVAPRKPERALPPPPTDIPIAICGYACVDLETETVDWRRALRGVDLRGEDRATRLLTLAIARVLGRRRGAIGLCVAQPRSSHEAIELLRSQLERHGLSGTAASAYSNSLTIMPAGAATRILQLCGPLSLVCAGSSGAAVALLWAAHQLRAAGAPACFVVASLDEAAGRAFAFELGLDGPVHLIGHRIAGPVAETEGLDSAAALAQAFERLRDQGGQLELRVAELGVASVELSLATRSIGPAPPHW